MIEHIKAYLRRNTFYRKYFQCTVNDCRYWIRNLKFYISHFRFHPSKDVKGGNTVYFVLDAKLKHPGLTDRLKVIACIYYVAKVNGFQFKLIFDEPFKLSDYLECNKIDWAASMDEISFSFSTSRMLAYNGMGKIPHLHKSVKQYIVYYYIGQNILECNKIENWEAVWRSCYDDLFVPSSLLINAIERNGYISKNYISVHFRFVNALESFESGYYNQLDKESQEQLIEKCLDCLRYIKEQSKLPVLVFSDSNRFLSIAKGNGFSILEGDIKHISYHADEDTILKTFSDFYMISRSKKVYRIMSKDLYGTTFSHYAAICGNCEFETIYLD